MQWSGRLCPVIKEKLGVFEKQGAGNWGIMSAEYLVEVSGPYEQHQVDVRARTCSCRKWDLTGIPCRHGICAIWHCNGKGDVDHFVDECYTVDTYLKTYVGNIHPMAGPDEWPESTRDPPLPPLPTAKAGRPRKLRKKSTGEITKDGAKVPRKTLNNN